MEVEDWTCRNCKFLVRIGTKSTSTFGCSMFVETGEMNCIPLIDKIDNYKCEMWEERENENNIK